MIKTGSQVAPATIDWLLKGWCPQPNNLEQTDPMVSTFPPHTQGLFFTSTVWERLYSVHFILPDFFILSTVWKLPTNFSQKKTFHLTFLPFLPSNGIPCRPSHTDTRKANAKTLALYHLVGTAGIFTIYSVPPPPIFQEIMMTLFFLL